MKKLLTSILTVLAISTNAFAAPGDADALAGLVFTIIGIGIAIYAGTYALYLLAFILMGLAIGIAVAINTIIILPIVFLINKISNKSYKYFSFTIWTKNKMGDLCDSFV